MGWWLTLLAEFDDNDRRAARLRRMLALFASLLLASTWRLWTPQTVFPQAAFIRAIGDLPAWTQWAPLAAMIAGLLLVAFVREGSAWRQRALWSFATALLALIVFDQQRFQAWAYQLLLYSVVLALAPARESLGLLRLLTISLYFYSALSKCDYSFLHSLGQQFLSSLLSLCGISTREWPSAIRLAGAWSFPIFELLIAVGLAFRRTRRVALVGAIAMHVTLLAILGPLGLGHRPGVLIWNVFFIVQDVLLFGGRKKGAGQQAAASEPSQPRNPALPSTSLAAFIVWIAVMAPALEPWGWFDHWPAWSLYAPRGARVSLFVHRSDFDRLPEALRATAVDDENGPWIGLRLDLWCLDSLGAPLYPQDRFQLAVTEAVTRRFDLQRPRAILWAAADRFSGERGQATLTSLAQIAAAGDRYLFNAHPTGPFLEGRRVWQP